MDTSTQNIFFAAAQQKLRFDTRVGSLGLEDIVDLSLVNLNEAAVRVYNRTSGKETTTFLSSESVKVSKEEQADRLRLDILKAVIKHKEEEASEKKAAADKASQLAFFRNLKEKSRLKQLDNMSEEEIQAEIDKLEGKVAEAPAAEAVAG